MSQKHSFKQMPQSVPWALIPDTSRRIRGASDNSSVPRSQTLHFTPKALVPFTLILNKNMQHIVTRSVSRNAHSGDSIERRVAQMGSLYVLNVQLNAKGVKAKFPTFEELATQKNDVTIDMSAVELLDGSGLGALAFIYKRLRSAGCQVKLINVRGQPLSVLEKLGVAGSLLANLNGAPPRTRTADLAINEASQEGV